MTWEIIVDWVVRAILFVYALITTIVAMKKSKKANIATGQAKLNLTDMFEVLNVALASMGEVEELFKSISKDGAKTGKLKLDSVLNTVERVCRDRNLIFDLSSWTTFITNVIKVKNSGSTEQSSQLDNEHNVQSVNVRFMGGNK